jgi:asparagine synthetase B (glutamine-hydrolysing)
VIHVAKPCLLFSAGPSKGFHDKMVQIFSIYRGHKQFTINTPTIKGFFQFDERVSDGVFQELPDSYFIELGLNFSKSNIEERIESLRSGHEKGLRRTLDGEVCQILISKRSGDVIIATDPFGLLPLYFHRSPEGAIISTDVKAILAVLPRLRTQLNKQSILEYISSHFILENRTLFDGVLLFPEGSISTFNITTPDAWTSSEWVTLPQHYENRDIDEWISLSAQLLEKSMNKRLQSGSGVFLSGGMDSRVVLAMIPKNVRRTMKALTFGVDNADDCRIAKRVAGIELEHVVLDTNIFM